MENRPPKIAENMVLVPEMFGDIIYLSILSYPIVQGIYDKSNPVEQF